MDFPPRIHVLLARDAPLGLVIRRGPAKSVCTLLWDRRNDSFQLGQWLRGRIYERRSDLSADGRYFIYFAMNGRWQSPAKGSWTAVSRAPYLKAISLFPKGDCWCGGGLFTKKNNYWLNQGCDPVAMLDAREVRPDNDFQPSGGVGGECLSVYYPRLLRDGWRLTKRRNDCDVFEKTAHRGWTLRKLAYAGIDHPAGTGCYWDRHELVHAERDLRLDFPDWEWAEVDRQRIVWATGGSLHAANLDSDGPRDPIVLKDFSGMKFEPIAAPY